MAEKLGVERVQNSMRKDGGEEESEGRIECVGWV